MSVERHRGKWRVRWRVGTRNRARSFDLKKDALAWDAEVRRRRQMGTLASLDAGTETLDEFLVDVGADVRRRPRAQDAQALREPLRPARRPVPRCDAVAGADAAGRRSLAGRPPDGGRRPCRSAARV